MISVWNRREEGTGSKGQTTASHVIDNFWDLLDIARRDYGVNVPDPT
jgi:hypothetical protein